MTIYDIALSIAISSAEVTEHLIDGFKDAKTVFEASPEELKRVCELSDTVILKLADKEHLLKAAQEELDFCTKFKIDILAKRDYTYPENLDICSDAPHILYSKGSIDFNETKDKWVAIVGTRKNTSVGNYYCDNLVRELAERHPDAVIVSGLAYGIDSIAHRSALKYGLKTVAFMAHGLDMIYPAQHRTLASNIISSGGAIVTEYRRGVKPLPPNFLARNRLVAGVSSATVVVESPMKGGAMATANIADSYSRELFAMVGRSSDDSFVGCNRLIKSNKAYMLENVKDLEYIMGWPYTNDITNTTKLSLTDEELLVYSCFCRGEEITVDEIVETSGLSVSDCLPILTSLELNDVIKQVKGMLYIKLK